MTGIILKETLLRRWRELLAWGVLFIVFALYVVILTPDPEGLQGYIRMLEAMPRPMLEGLGLTDLNVLATPEGFLGFAYLTYAAVVISIYAVLAGLNITANDEESGAMNMLLALPLPRWRVVAERAAAFVLMTVVVSLAGWLGVLLGKGINPAIASVDDGKMLQATLAQVPLALIVMGVTALFGVLIRRRNIAAAAAGAFVVVSYVLNALGGAAGEGVGDMLTAVSFYNYYDGTSIALNGLDILPVVLMLAVALALLAGATHLFTRRDISS